MIYESYYWKEELEKVIKNLVKRTAQRRWPDRALTSVEKEVFIGFYIVRKLLESKKLSDELRHKTYPVKAYRNKGMMVHHLNTHRVEELYNLNSSTEEQRTTEFLTNTLIHSYVFLTWHSPASTLEAILFNSDRTKNKYLYHQELRRAS